MARQEREKKEPTSIMPTPPPSLWRERKRDAKVAAAAGGGIPAPSASNVQWEWREFGNPARNDGLILKHWCKKGQPLEYPFSQFNKKAAILKYSTEEYTKHLTVGDWDKKETDELLALAERYALNFIVIADRWPHSKRSSEELKERFYSTQRKLAEVKGLGAEGEQDGILLGHPYNREWEEQRKDNLMKLMLRSKAEEREDLETQAKARKIDEAQRRARKADLKKKKQPDPDEPEPPLCPLGASCVRSSMVSKRAEKAGVLKWLATSGQPVTHSSQKTQQVFTALCNNVIELLDWQKQVARKRKEREIMYDKKQDLVRPLKKRKAAPNQKFSDMPGPGGATPQAGNPMAANTMPPAAPAPRPSTNRHPVSGQFTSDNAAPQKKRKH